MFGLEGEEEIMSKEKRGSREGGGENVPSFWISLMMTRTVAGEMFSLEAIVFCCVGKRRKEEEEEKERDFSRK